MEELAAIMDKWPSWVGGVPALATLIIVIGYIVIQWLKNQPVMAQQKIDERLNIKTGYRDTIARLEQQVHECHEESRERERQLQDEIDVLKARINNEAFQRVQSEISLVNTLIQVVDAPQLQIILKALEAKQVRLSVLQRAGAEDAERT